MSREALRMQPGPNTKFPMPNIEKNRPYRAHVPDGHQVLQAGRTSDMVPLMAYGAALRYDGKRLTSAQWGAMLRRMRFANIGTLPEALSRHYPNPLSFEEWADLFEQLATEHVLATKYPHLQ